MPERIAKPVAKQNLATPIKHSEAFDQRAVNPLRPEHSALVKLQSAADDSGVVHQLNSMQAAADAGRDHRMTGMGHQATRRRGHAASALENSISRTALRKIGNRTGLPDGLKSGVEQLSGVSLHDVKVHRNSPQPAQLKAEAFAQGTDIHLGPGQDHHLPHEAWHVAQQKQGRVKPSTRLPDAVPLNDDASLEAEADHMGAAAARLEAACMGTQQGALQAKMISGSPTVQMAGHAGVMIFGNGGRLLKRIEVNEFAQFLAVMAAQQGDPESDDTRRALAAFPTIYRVFDASDLDGGEIKGDYGDTQTVNKWLRAGGNGDYYVEMESVGGANIDVLDFKIGTATADKEELMANYGKSERQADKKVNKMAKIDQTTETESFGLRDSDAAKSSIKDNLNRILRGKFVPTLADITVRVMADEASGDGPYVADDRAIADLDNIREYIQTSDTVYIASSLVMKWNQDRTQRAQDRVVLIDLAHPMTDDMEGFEKAKQGMLLGIANLRRILLGEDLQGAVHDAAAPEADEEQIPQDAQQES